MQNILIDTDSAELVHIDLGMLSDFKNILMNCFHNKIIVIFFVNYSTCDGAMKVMYTEANCMGFAYIICVFPCKRNKERLCHCVCV